MLVGIGHFVVLPVDLLLSNQGLPDRGSGNDLNDVSDFAGIIIGRIFCLPRVQAIGDVGGVGQAAVNDFIFDQNFLRPRRIFQQFLTLRRSPLLLVFFNLNIVCGAN